MKQHLQQAVTSYWHAANDRRWQDFANLVHPDIIYEVPQTRERVRGRQHYVEFNRTFPGDWQAQLQTLVADDDQAVSKIAFEVDGSVAVGISFFEFREGLISRIVDYWPEPYQPPTRQCDCVEHY